MLTCDRVMKAACSAVVGLNLSGICHVAAMYAKPASDESVPASVLGLPRSYEHKNARRNVLVPLPRLVHYRQRTHIIGCRTIQRSDFVTKEKTDAEYALFNESHCDRRP